MKIAPPNIDDARFDMTPMMDIVFQLIAFFMIVSTFLTLEKVELDLPIAKNAAPSENQQGRVNLAVQADGTTLLGSRPMDLDAIGAAIIAWQRENPGGKVVIRADRETPYSSVKAVMKLCRDAGLSDIIFSSYQSDQ
jgi:biopolymer transport protein ExbD